MCFCQKKNPYVHLRRKRTYVLMVMGVGGVKTACHKYIINFYNIHKLHLYILIFFHIQSMGLI